MGAPKGNTFWKIRSKHGRDTLFASPEELWIAACEYFTWCDKHPWYKTEQVKKPFAVINEKTGKTTWITTTQIPTARPYTIQGLCAYLDCNSVYFNHFETDLKGKEDDKSKDFSKVVTRIRETIFQQKFEGAAVGSFNANIIARELGIADKKENRNVDKSGNDVPPPDQAPQIIIMQAAGETIEIKESEE